MRVHSLVVGIAIALLAVVGADATSTANDRGAISSSLPESSTITGENNVPLQRLLRQHEDAKEEIKERRLFNLDLALKDAIHTVRMKTKWQAQFAAWKYSGKTPFTLGKNLGVITDGGIIVRDHKDFAKFVAYSKFYS